MVEHLVQMESVKPSEVITPRKSRLGRAFAKVLHIRAATKGISPHDELIKKTKAGDDKIISFFDDQDEEKRIRAVEEAFLAKIFASVSSVKAAYACLQFAQSPYDADGIQSSDQMIVSELKKVSELKYCYLNKTLKDFSPGRTLVLAEVQEQKSLLRTYEITSKKLDYQLKLKDSEITFLKEKLEEAESDNKLLEKRLNSSGQLSVSAEIITKLSSLRPTHFIAYYRQSVKSIRSFVNLLINEMEISGWDLDVAARSIEPGISFWKSNHTCFAFESYVCREMFDGFNHPNFSIQTQPENKRVGSHRYFDQFLELRSAKAADYLAWKPKSSFASFCRAKYLKLVHPKMEEGLFGNLDHRDLVDSGGALPETPFFLAFIEMAKRVWLLHCLSLSFDPEVSIFQVRKGTRFSDVYMESLSDEAFDSKPETDPARVAFVVVPGFRIGKTVLQCQVYLC